MAHFVASDSSRLTVPLPRLDRPPSRRTAAGSASRSVLLAAAAQPLLSASSASSPPAAASSSSLPLWRQHSRTRTSAACLILCLNIGVDPPDSVRAPSASQLQCWMEPSSLPPLKALKQIGARLQAQYERWSSQCAYRLLLDPTSDDMRKLIGSVRKQAAAVNERVLLHYNGHGVPRPTGNGEVWVYNRGYTQYIPVSMYDVQAWMGGVSGAGVYVIDCNAAGLVMDAFLHFLKQRKDKLAGTAAPPAAPAAAAADLAAATSSDPYDCRHIFLCACSATESLPSLSYLPADLFTSCLTTPIKTALRFAISRSTLCRLQPASIDSLPGIKKPNNRRTAYGELNWIFTAITDAIAWSTLPLPLFQQLFRHDLLVASLFRNYWLAERILHAHGVHTVTHPPLPATHSHPMWAAWDVCVDATLAQLERYEQKHDTAVFSASAFFSQQLTAFEVYLDYAAETDPPPLQLPVLLQVLLSSDHRKRALLLLARYIDKGGWAVNSALSVGVFPYVLKLLQSVDEAMRPCLVFIWAKIAGWDETVVGDLCKAGGDYVAYFVRHLLGWKGEPARERRQQQQQQEEREEDEAEEKEESKTDREGRDGLSSTPSSSSSSSRAMRHSSSFIFAPSPHFLSPAVSQAATPSRTPPSLLPTHPVPPLPPPPLSSTTQPTSVSAPHAITDAVSSLLSTRPLQQLLSAFVLTAIATHNPRSATAVLTLPLTSLSQLLQPQMLQSSHPLLRRWLLLLTSALLSSSPTVVQSALSEHVADLVYPLLFDPTAEVRAAALLALSSFISPPSLSKEQARIELELHLGYVMSALSADGSALVRRECVLAVGEVIWAHSELFVAVSGSSSGRHTAKKAYAVWRALLRLCRDAHPTVSTAALELRKWVKSRVLFSNPLGRMIQSQHNHGIKELPAFSPISEVSVSESVERDKDRLRERDRERREEHERKERAGAGGTTEADGGQPEEARPSMAPSERDESDDMDAPVPPARPVVPLAGPLRHFDRYKMSHMRPHPNASLTVPSATSAAASATALHSSPASSSRRTAASPSLGEGDEQASPSSSSSSISSSTASSSAAVSSSSYHPSAVDDRVNDPTWTLPKSSLYAESTRYFSAPLLTPPASFQPIPPLQSLSAQSARSSVHSSLSARASVLASDYKAGDPSNARSFVEVAFFDTEWTSCGGGGGGDGGGLVLHPYENVLVACDDRSGIGVWRYGVEEERGQERVNAFSNDNVRGSRITKLALVNSKGEGSASMHDESDERGQSAGLLMCASDDGVVRLWRGIQQAGKQSLVTAWTACPAPDGLLAGVVARAGPEKPSLPRPSPPLNGREGGPAAAAMYVPSSSPPSSKPDSLLTPLLSTITPSPPSASLSSPSHSLPPASTSFSLRRRTAHPPVTFDWNQSTGHLCIAGHGQAMCKLWDVTTERCVLDVSVLHGSRYPPPSSFGLAAGGGEAANSSSGITCLLFSPADTSTVYVGSRDGSVFVLDVRSGQSSHLRSHSSPVVSLQAQLFNHSLLSASSNGDVLISDYRLSAAAPLSPLASPLSASSSPLASSTRQLHRPSHHSSSSPLTCFSAHRHLPLLASGSSRPFVDLFDIGNFTLEQIRYHYGFLGQRLGSVSTVVYHEYKQLVAVGCLDPYISIFAAEAL